MRFFEKINTNFRFPLVLCAINLLILFMAGSILYNFESSDIEKELGASVEEELASLSSSFKLAQSYNIKQLTISNLALKTLFENQFKVAVKDSELISVDGFNQTTEVRQELKLKQWLINGKEIYNESWLIDKLTTVTDCYISVFQKVPEGYIQMCTNLKDRTGNSLVNYLLPNSSLPVLAIEKGLTFNDKLNFAGITYIAMFQPIVQQGKKIGMYGIYLKEYNSDIMNSAFQKKTYFEQGNAGLIDKFGTYITHKTKEGQAFFDLLLFEKFKPIGGRINRLEYTNFEYGIKKQYYLYYYYQMESETYIYLNVDRVELEKPAADYLKYIFKLLSILFIISVLLVYVVCIPLTNQLKKIIIAAYKLAQGVKVELLEVKGKGELSQLSSSLNSIISTLEHTSAIALEIGKGNFHKVNKSLEKTDLLGNSLLEMNEQLAEAQKKQEGKQKLEEIQKWTADGISLFNDILRTKSSNLTELSQNFIKSFIEYTGANQGALFLLRRENGAAGYFDMLSSYAYNKTRNQQKQIEEGSGLIGRAALEKKLIYITDIPDNYLTITSGLGERKPNFLAIVPLLINDEPIGAIEIASFNEITAFKQDFINQIASMVAVTINTAIANQHTAILLQQSQRQSEELALKEETMRKNIEDLQTAQQVAESKELEQHGILEALYQATYLIQYDMNGFVIDVNQNLVNLLKLDRNTIVGLNHREISTLSDKSSEIEKHWDRLKQNKSLKIEEELSFHKSEKIKFQTSYTPILDIQKIPFKVLCILSVL